MANCSNKNDPPDVAREKGRNQREADKRMLHHLQEHVHERYPVHDLFPPSVYTWNAEKKAYEDNVEEKLQLLENEQKLVSALCDLRQDSKETHFVGVSGLSQRSDSSKNPRPLKMEPGHIVIVRSEDSSPCSSYLPFYVGEVLGFEKTVQVGESETNSGDSSWTKVHTVHTHSHGDAHTHTVHTHTHTYIHKVQCHCTHPHSTVTFTHTTLGLTHIGKDTQRHTNTHTDTHTQHATRFESASTVRQS